MITTDKSNALNSDMVLAYGEQLNEETPFFESLNLLFEDDIYEQKIEVFQHEDKPVFFGHNNTKAELPYDAFSLIFFMLTRYEEYLPFQPDEHGRFPAKTSIAYQNQFLEEPIVEYAIQDIINAIQKKHPQFKPIEKRFEMQISYDVDSPFAYRGKGFFKNLGGSFNMLRNGYLKPAFDRLFFTLVGGKDPFDIFYDILLSLQTAEQEAIFFLLLENKGENNPTISPKHYALDILFEKLANNQAVGIHPSYNCDNPSQLTVEMNRFEQLLQSQPKLSRFHFIQLNFPEKYELLLRQNILHDYSMAFPEQFGFRAGCTRPFPFFNLKTNTQTDLIIHPFCLMDATFEYYHNYVSEENIWSDFETVIEKVKKVNGVVHAVFHNDLVSGYLAKHDWLQIHEAYLKAMYFANKKKDVTSS